MSEVNERNMENAAPETAENNTAAEQSAPQADDRENAPRGENVKPEEKSAGEAKKKGKKKRKRAKIALPVVAVLVVLALLFGIIVGYTFGRGVGVERLQEAEARIEELTEALEASAAVPVYDEFNEELTGENQDVLSDLAGEAFDPDGDVSALLGEDGLLGEVDPGAGGEPVVVAEFEGGVLMSDEVAREYSEQMTNLVFAGYNEDEIAGTLLPEVMRYMVGDRVMEQKAKEMGLYELTDEDRAMIEAEAEEAFAAEMEFYRGFVNTSGMSDEEADGAVKAYMLETEGITLETVRADIEAGWWAQKLYDAVTADVTVDDAALQAAYDTKLAEQKESFEAYPDDYEFAQINGDTILYNLPGYRGVQVLLFAFEDPEAVEAVYVLSEEVTELDPEADAAMIEDYKGQIQGYYAPVVERAQDALKELESGADFEDMMVRVGSDDGMRDERLRKSGYYISADSLLWSPEVISAAMALEKSGDISGVVCTPEGACILRYVGEVPAGEVPLADVRDALMEDTLEQARYDAFQQQLDQWLEEAKVVYYPERMQ